MAFWEHFPYTNFHDMNMSWILEELKKIEKYVQDYTAINKVAYAGIWNITKQYPQWAVVSDGNSSYLSTKPVPVGIAITNDEYWTQLADLDPRVAALINEVGNLQTAISNIRPLNMESYGCDSSGTVECTQLIVQALNEGYKHLYFPAGTYLIGTVNLVSGVTISGDGVNTVFKSVSDVDLFTCADFDTYKDGVATESVAGTVNSITLRDFKIESGKRNIALYGWRFYIVNVLALNASDINIYLCSPGAIHSTDERSLQNVLLNVTCGYGHNGNIFYNGQSDSLFANLLCYYTDTYATQFDNAVNVNFATKGSGCKVVNAHLWGHCAEHLHLDAGNCTFNNLHVEGALTQMYIIRPLTEITNLMCYDPLHTGESTAIKLGQYASALQIQGIIRQCGTVIDTQNFNPSDINLNFTVRDVPDDFTLFTSALTGGVYFIQTRTTGGTRDYAVRTPAFRCVNNKLSIGSYVYDGGASYNFNAYLEVLDNAGTIRRIPVIS